MTLHSSYSSVMRSGLIFVRFSDRLENYHDSPINFFFHLKVELALAARLKIQTFHHHHHHHHHHLRLLLFLVCARQTGEGRGSWSQARVLGGDRANRG